VVDVSPVRDMVRAFPRLAMGTKDVVFELDSYASAFILDRLNGNIITMKRILGQT